MTLKRLMAALIWVAASA
ncbi:hypothetical protein, partial [Pseudomonas savastanoi]